MSIDIANEFYDLHDIDINGKKSELIVINATESIEEQTIRIGRNQDIVTASTGEVRYLGCYFSAKKSRKRLKARITSMIEDFLKPLRSKFISNAHIVYLVNKILNPRIAYVAQLTSLSVATWDKLYKPILRLVKNKCNLSRSTPTASLQHGHILGLDDIFHTIVANQIAAFTYILNSRSIATTTAIIRCRTAQINLALHTPIFHYDLASLLKNKAYRYSNEKFNTIIIAAQISIRFEQDHIGHASWNISGGHTPIRDAFIESKKVQVLPHINQQYPIPLMFVEQLTLPNNEPISWIFHRQMNKLSTKGRVANWFEPIRRWISNNHDILQLNITSVATSINDYFPRPADVEKTSK
jgi:hypothetical protein